MTRIGTFVGALLYHSSGKSFALVQQLTFLVVLVVPVSAVTMDSPANTSFIGVAVGLGLLFVTTGVVVFAPERGLPRTLEWLVPVTSIISCGICRLATYPDGGILSTLSLVPAVWLVVRFRTRGAALAILMVILTISLPSMVVVEETMSVVGFFRYMLLPLALALMSFAVIGILQRLEASNKELKRAVASERALRIQREHTDRLLREVGENLNVGVLVMDARGNDVMTNRAQREIHSVVSPEDNADPTEAGHLIFYTDGTPVPTQNRPAARANRGEEFDSFQFLAGHSGPEQRVISATARTVFTEDGERDASFVIFRDATEEYHTLRAQHEVIATVSHEMRTPLTSIVGFADFTEDSLLELPESDDRSDAMEHLQVIRRNAEKLNKLVEDLLLEQQAAVGRLTLHPEPVQMDHLIADSVKGLRPLAEQRRIAFELDLYASGEVLVDKLRLAQVLDNLLNNAVKYAHPGGTVTVRTRSTAAAVTVEVADDGPGMTQHEASQVFTAFYRAPSARSSATPGAGLGLALSQAIIEAHGGTIQVQSAPGEGARFKFTLGTGAVRGGLEVAD